MSFDRPIGAEADVKELEYISFLHQTTSGNVRTDCSIKDEDIRIYLMSRYGINVDIDLVQQTIIQGLGGGNDIDLMEVAAMLLIPILLKSAAADFHDTNSFRQSMNHHHPQRGGGFDTNDDGTSPKQRSIFGGIGSHKKSTTTTTTPKQSNRVANDNNNNEDDTTLYNRIKKYFFEQGNIYNDDEVMDAALAEAIADDEIVNDENKVPSLAKGVLLPPANLFDYASKIILHDCFGSSTARPLTKEVLVDILNNYGEYEIAANDELVEEMVKVATTPIIPQPATSTSSGPDTEIAPEEFTLFDGATFANATTYDVQKYDISAETKMTTLYDDVFPPQRSLRKKGNQHTATIGRGGNDNNNNNDYDDTYNSPNKNHGDDDDDTSVVHNEYGKRVFTAPQIDVTAGTFRSKTLMVLLWASAIITFCIFYLRRFDNTFETNKQNQTTTTTGFDLCQDYPYNHSIAALESPWVNNAAPVGCNVGNQVLNWLLLFLKVGSFGLAYTAVGSIGNTIFVSDWYHPLYGCVPILVLSAVSFFNPPSLPYLQILSYCALLLGFYVVCLHLAHVISIIVSEEHINTHPGVRNYLNDDQIEWLRKRYRPRLIEAELLGKQAMAHKLNTFIRNSVRLFRQVESKENVIDTYYGRAIHAYSKEGIHTIERNIGGIRWTLRNIWNKTLFSVEGVRFSVRVLASNIGQYVVCMFIVWAGYKLLYHVDQSYGNQDELKAMANDFINQQINIRLNATIPGANVSSGDITANTTALVSGYLSQLQNNQAIGLNCSEFSTDDYYQLCRVDSVTGETSCQNTSQAQSLCALSNSPNLTAPETIQLLNNTGFDIDQLSYLHDVTIESTIDDFVDTMYPSQKYMVQAPVLIGVLIAFFTAVSLAVGYISSISATILQLRCGKIETLHSRDAAHYRAAADTVALLSGSIFWGCLVSSMVTGVVWGFVVFLFVWQVSVFWAQKIFAIVIGLLTITLLKLLTLLVYRSRVFAGFYRTNPVFVNIGVLALEWANFTLSAGIIFVRMIKLLVIAGFSIGRVYRPFLAPGLGRLGPIELDGYFTIQLRELMAHEAHRHPYLELLGYIYLMKLKYSSEFGKAAGSCWRLLFVHALFPWLQRYRIEARRPTAYRSDVFFTDIRRPAPASVRNENIATPPISPSSSSYYNSNNNYSSAMSSAFTPEEQSRSSARHNQQQPPVLAASSPPSTQQRTNNPAQDNISQSSSYIDNVSQQISTISPPSTRTSTNSIAAASFETPIDQPPQSMASLTSV